MLIYFIAARLGTYPPLMNPAMMPPIGNIPTMQQPVVGGLPFDMLNQKVEMKIDESEEAKMEKKRKAEAERKKEEDEKAKQQISKPQDKSRPVSSTPIAGTPWCVVWTGDGKVFFYNPSSRTSVWDRPDELVGRPDVDKAMAAAPDQPATANSVNSLVKKTTDTETAADASVIATKDDKDDMDTSETVNADEETAESGKRSDSESTTENDQLSKKIKLGENIEPRVLTEKKADLGKEAAIEAEVRAARERALVPLETRVQQFKDMLKEKDVC